MLVGHNSLFAVTSQERVIVFVELTSPLLISGMAGMKINFLVLSEMCQAIEELGQPSA